MDRTGLVRASLSLPRLAERQNFYLLSYALLVTALLFAGYAHWGYDDPFITYRYAHNIQQGVGFVYNPGEPVLSTTTPLFAILLAVLSSFSADLPRLAVLVGAAAIAAGALFLWDIARSWKSPAVGWAALLLYPVFPLLVNTLSSETPLYLAFCLGAFAFYARRSYPLAAFLSALAVLTRPDGLLVPVLLALDFLIRERGAVPWRAMAIFLGLLAAWVGFAWIAFGSPVPVTLAAKQQQGAMAISQRFFEGFFTTLSWYSSWPYWFEYLLAAVGLVFATARARSWLLIWLWTALYFVSYSVLGVSRYFWYYTPLVPGLIAAAGAGASALAQFKWNQKINWGAVAASALIGVILLMQAGDLWRMRLNPDNRLLAYRAVGQWLNQNTEPEATVGALEVGIIGYYAQRPMIDFAGLIQPEIAQQLREETTYEDVALWATEHYQPIYLVLQDQLFPRLEAAYIQNYCREEQRFSSDDFGYSHDLVVYNCR